MRIPLPLKIKVVSQTASVGVFEIEGLYPGYGQTIGNSMRRVLLSSLDGAVITSVKIEGAAHEFSVLEGVMEDAVELILNLKQVRFRLHGEGPVAISLSVKGEREVTAGDFTLPSQVEVFNPDVHIATLSSKKSFLKLEAEVESGRGYVAVEQRKKEKVQIGTIALDAAFSPVRHVTYEVENMRVGDRTDYNRLRCEIETDGSLSPGDAFTQGAEILVEQFTALTREFESVVFESVPLSEEKPPRAKRNREEPSEEEEKENAAMKAKLEDTKISSRTLNALREAGIKTVGGVARKREETLREIEGIGDKGIQEIRKALGNLGITLKS
ncbi:MAG: DNA-directed RNA polymerase subunit alpha [Candidatus Sungbacteria bacterium]|nr:DNA-directed RNA polymerase subunit alpha [Candidatus Sungbacteria bacterium]